MAGSGICLTQTTMFICFDSRGVGDRGCRQAGRACFTHGDDGFRFLPLADSAVERRWPVGWSAMSDGRPPAQLRLLDDLPPAVEPARPRLAVTGLVSYARCPRQCYWDVVERRPRPLRPAARIGSLVHGWIEREAAGQGSLLAAEARELHQPPPEAGEDDAWIAEFKAAFPAP